MWLVGVCDDCGVWAGVLHQNLGGWLLLQIPGMAGTAEICQKALLCYRLVCLCEEYTKPKCVCVCVHVKIVKSNRLFCMFLLFELLSCRLHSICGLDGSDCCRYAGQHLRHISLAQHAIPADPAYGSYGPTGRNLETTGLSGLRS